MDIFQQPGLIATAVALPLCIWLWSVAYRHPEAFRKLSEVLFQLDALTFMAALGYYLGALRSIEEALQFVPQDRYSEGLSALHETLPPLGIYLLMALFAGYLLFLRALPALGIVDHRAAQPPLGKKPGDD